MKKIPFQYTLLEILEIDENNCEFLMNFLE